MEADGVEIFSDKKCEQDIDNLILTRWNNFMMKGSFRYNIDKVLEKVLPGKFSFLVQYQPNRSSNRRPPQSMTSVLQEFNVDQFNFTKVNKEREVVAVLSNSRERSSLPSKDVIIINVSPIDLGHCLLVPQLDCCLPQVLTTKSMKTALDVMYLSKSPNIKLAFNSLCGYASVNHLHFHLYYQSHRLPVQTAGLQHVKRNLFIMTEETYPAPAWVWLLDISDITQISETAENVVKLTYWLSKQDIAHNLFITRGCSPAGETSSSGEYIRIIVWARETVRGVKDAGQFVIAVCELSGQMLVYDHQKYLDIQPEEISMALQKATTNQFRSLHQDVKMLFE